MLQDRIRAAIRDIPDFPKPGILFKDITPVFYDPALCNEIIAEFRKDLDPVPFDAIIGIESRGFLFGLPLSLRMFKPFVLVRKAGKLPYHTVRHAYDLEYGSAVLEMHADAIRPGQKVLIHDDLLATGGTALAAAALVKKQGAEVAGFSFLAELDFLEGRKKIQEELGVPVWSIIRYK